MSQSHKFYSIFFCLIFLVFVAPINTTFAQTCIDADADGYGMNGDASCPNLGVDCDDDDPNVYPDAPRICDGKDSDCDGFEDFFSDKDQDGDGSTLCTHWLTGLRDCDDNNPVMFPGNIEGPFGDATCTDGFDNDCDYRTDGSDDGCSVNCIDSDNDGYGSPGNITCPNGDALDCNNTNPNIYPGAPDAVCNGVDDNCSGTPDDDYVPTPTNCGIGECASTGSIICVAGVESDTCVAGTPQPEVCSGGLDEDCDGLIDQVPGIEDPACGSCADNDLDGYGANDDPSCTFAGTDCDDNDPTTYPGAPDAVCNGVDNNCSGTADDEYVPPTTFCGIGQCATTGLDECQTGVVVDTCSPLAPGTEGPFGDPTCSDTLDNDCDGVVDAPDNDCNPLDQDNDGDGFCEVGPCQNPVNLDGDCDDTNPVVYPGAPRLCDAVDNDCDGYQDFFTDRDGDGDGATMCEHYLTGIKDCDDNNADRSPLIIEAPFGGPLCSDTIDNDCDYRIDGADMGCAPGCPDNDGDGFTDINCGGPDCNDGDPNICPTCPDVVCDGLDNNCSGTPDDEYVPTVTNCGVGECINTGTLTCSGGVELEDCTPLDPSKEGAAGNPTCTDTLDNDCDTFTDASDPGCQSNCLDDDGDGYGYFGDASCPIAGVDCDDDNAAINPGAPDAVCDGVDDNCDGTPDDQYVPTDTNCGIGECFNNGQLVCNAGVIEDNCQPLLPGVEGPVGDPTCSDTLDNDCDGAVDQPDPDCNPPDQDNDGDGFCEVGPCQNPVNLDGDCDDSDPLTYPAAPRLCDGKDNDCDGFRDFFTDRDADGDGSTMCEHWQTGLKDCDDNNALRSPEFLEAYGMPECQDGIDNDCNFKTDLADPKCLTPCNDVDNDGFGLPGHPECPNGGQTDCNDNDANVYPGAPDAVCNGIDNNCSGTPDDEYVPTATNCGIGECADTGTLTCSGGVETDTCTPLPPAKEGPSWHPTCTGGLDEDCDGLIDLIDPDPGCTVTCLDEDGDGYGYYGDASCPNSGVDCDDDNPAINPGVPDSNCDNVDDNCSGIPDDEYVPTPTICGIGECSTSGQLECQSGVEVDTCIPLEPQIEGPAGDATCIDTFDNDCDTFIDSADIDCNSPEIDDDGDGYCEGPTCSDGSIPGDCDDTDPNRYPGGDTTICDGKDTNCDGFNDFFTDVDNDGDGVPLCEHYLTGLADCDDSDPDRYPGNQEGPFGDPTCSDTIDNDCDFKTDAADSDCQPPTCGTTVGQIKDGPHMFDLLDGGNNVLKTPCQWCHITDYQGTMIDERVECQRCHALASDTSDPLNGILKEQVPGPVNGNPAPTAYPADPPYGFGTAQDVKLHSSTVVGTTHGNWDMDCLTCHNPHQQEQDGIYGTSYGKYIKEFICFDNTAIGGGNFEEIVEFTAATGPGAFADGPPYNENICNMCHTLTNHHRRDDAPPAPGGQDHNNDQNCTNCHPHDEGFKPFSVADAPHNNTANPGLFDLCSVCHVSEIDFTTPVPSTNCLNCHDETAPNNAGGGSDIKVRSHFIGTMECIECHNPMFEQINFRGNTNLSHVRTTVNGNEIAFEAKTGPFSFADDTNAAANGMLPENYICNTCHTLTNHHQADGDAPGGQSHNDGLDCTGCHTHQGGTVVPDAFRDHIERSQADAPHNNTANPGLFDQCSVCHVAEDDYVTPVPNTKCLNCHSVAIAQTGPADSHHTAGNGSHCIDCHNPMREQINFRGNPNLSHIRTSINGTEIVLEAKTGDYGFAPNGSVPPDMNIENYICNTCHTLTNHHQADGTAPLGQSHNNGTDCTLCHTHRGEDLVDDDAFKDHPLTIADQPHNSTATPGFNDDCNLCHVDGVSPAVPIPNSKCNGCHAVGTPDQAGGGANTKLETHHTPADRDCVECHNPMGQTGGNAYHIRLVVNGEPIVFTGVNDYAAGDGTGLCEVCHTSNTHYVNVANQPAQLPDHNVGSNCTTADCHTHDTGMAPPGVADVPHDTITDCTLCHDPGTYVDGATLDNNKCLGCHSPAGPATTVETHHIPADLNCTDCHNPMNVTGTWRHIKPTVDGSTLVSFGNPTTPATGGEYADGLGNGLCEVCHDSLTLSYYNSDGSGASHNDGSVCTSCHTHDTGMAPPGVADAPHDGITDCTLCHDPGTYVDGATLSNIKCLGCHGPAGPATTVETHHTPADLNCTDCHNPMNVTGTWRHIKPTVDGSTLVSFGNPTTPATGGEYADGLGNGLCEVCHDSLTLSYYNSDGSGAAHMTDVCTTCHTHDTGMVPPTTPLADVPHDTITDCTQCHSGDDYVDGATLDNTKCLGCHGPAGPATTVETHHTPADLNCTDCHNPMNVTGTWRHIKPTVDGSTLVSFGNPTTPATGGEYADGLGNGLCEVCHDSLTLSYYNSDGSGAAHMTDVCTTCHTHDTGMVAPITPIADTPHDTITDCTQCHSGDDYADGATLDNNKCLGCHGPAGPATTVETHHTPADLNCTDCHNPMNVTGTWRHIKPTVDGSTLISFGNPTTPATGGEYADGLGNGLCEVCHDSLTLSYYNSDGSGAAHNEGDICTTCHTHPTGFASPTGVADEPHETITDCTLCHSGNDYADGATLDNNKCLGCHGPAGPATTVETHHTPADLNCTDCHNPMNVTGTWRHIKPTVDGSTLISFGNPTTPATAGEYADGLGNGLCEVCHDSLTLSYYNSDGSGAAHMTDVCTTCHTHDTGMAAPITPIADTPHDTITDCTQCHSGDDYADGATLDNNKCLGCHGPAGPATTVETHHTPADLNCTDCHNPMNVTGTWRHIKPTVDGSTLVSFGNPTTPATAGEYADGLGNGLCEVCHDSLTLSYYNSDGSGASHNDGSVCTSCHTHDTGMAPPGVADVPHNGITDCTLCHDEGTYVDGATLSNTKCLGCHGPGGSTFDQTDDFTGLTTGAAGRPNFGNWTGISGSDATNGWMAWNGPTDSSGTGPSTGDYVVLESSPTVGSGGGNLNQNDGFTGLDTGSAGRPVFGNWTGVNGSDGTNGWMVWNGATASSGTGPSAGNPGEYVVLESSPTTGGGSPGLVSILNPWTNVVNGGSSVPGTTYSIGSGTNRLLLVSVSTERSSAGAGTFTVSYGGKPLTQINKSPSGSVVVWFGYLKEADIASRSGDTLSVSVGTSVTGIHVDAISLTGVDQTTPITDTTAAYAANKKNLALPVINIGEGDRLIINGLRGNTLIAMDTTGYTKSPVISSNNFASLTAYRNSTAAGTASPTYRGGNNTKNTNAVIGVSIKAATVAGGDSDPANGVDLTAGSEQYLVSNVIDASAYVTMSVSLDWNMNVSANSDASLHLDAWNGTSWDLDITGGAVNTGNNGDTWTSTGSIDLSGYNNADFQLRIRYIVGTNGEIYHNDVAVDNIVILGTGPVGDEDPVNGVDVTAGSEQYLVSNVIDAGAYDTLNFTLDFNMNVNDNADASLHLDAWNGTAWDLDVTGGAVNTGNAGDIWITVGPVDLRTYVNADFQLRFRYIVGSGTIHQNDIAVDNLVFAGSSGGVATQVETHHTPADLNCTDCHNPMNVTGTWRHIKPTVDGSTLVSFGNPTTPATGGEYADGLGNGLCEVCHDSLTLSYYNSDGSGAAHMTDVCTTCHTHDTGMVAPITPIADTPHDTITDCTQCHSGDDYADGATLDNNKCLGCHGPAGPATTVETHHTPADLNCTDCHNPMNVTGTWRHIKPTVDGSALVSFGNPTTPATGGEYADGLGNGLCEVCHDSLTLSYYNSDGSGASHNDGSVCTSCHTHDTGMAPPGVADVPHDGITDCTLCHDEGTYVDGATLSNIKCLGCHGPAGPATTVETHHTPADLNCTDCHNPMNATGTWRHIKPTVDESTLVSFGNPTTPATGGEYADGLGNGLCEVCHDAGTLSYYNSDGSGASHNDGSVCTSCHTHDTGMAPPGVADAPHDGITDCTLCHDPGTYVDGADIDKAKCYGCHGPAGPATTVETHHTPADLNCTDCHNPMNVTGTWRHIKPTVDGSTLVSFGNPTTPATGGEYADGNGNGLCEVCHDSLTLDYYNSDGSGFTHNDGSVCTICHTHETGMAPPIVLADAPHEGITDCTLCHDPGTYVDGADIDKAKCYGCHGPSGPATTVDTHHTPPDLNCTDCHNPMNPTGNWRHIKPTVNGATIVFGTPTTAPSDWTDFVNGAGDGLCEVCHAGTTYYNDSGTGAMHMMDICTNCHTHGNGFIVDDPADTPHDAITDCLECHNGADYFAGATLDNAKCLVCHGPGGPAIEAAAHQSPLAENCTDCHNPMRDQTPNIKHVKTGLASFTGNTVWTDFVDGAGNGVCETCHTNTTYYTTNGDGLPHETDVCTNCHEHVAGFSASGTCISCHTNVPGGATYVRRAVVGSDFTQASRHVFGGNGTTDVTQWDCAVCHMEANESLAALGGVDADTRDANLHNNSGGIVVDLRNVDDASNDAAGWTWNKKDGTCDNGSYDNITDCIDNGAIWTWNNEQMLTDMDNFCMSCHDGDGASTIAVNGAGTAVVLNDGPCTAGGGELACTPFNDALRTTNTQGGTAILDDNQDGIPDAYERTEVLDVFTQFDPTNPSHHAVRGQAYTDTSCNVYRGGDYSEDVDVPSNNCWGTGAWVNRQLKSGNYLVDQPGGGANDGVFETAALHCADCHTVDYNAHGGTNGFMLQAASIDGTCYLCHNQSAYEKNPADTMATRWDHANEGSVYDPADGSKLGTYGGVEGSMCLNCHGGDPAVEGFGGIHGLQSGTDWRSGQERYRFQGGSYMSHDPGDWTGTTGSATCYFAGTTDTQAWSNCTKHDAPETGGRTAPPRFSRGVAGDY